MFPVEHSNARKLGAVYDARRELLRGPESPHSLRGAPPCARGPFDAGYWLVDRVAPNRTLCKDSATGLLYGDLTARIGYATGRVLAK